MYSLLPQNQCVVLHKLDLHSFFFISFPYDKIVNQMASRRKQEERHLQTLKKIQQIDCNKKCFECDQRGPTYVDVTIGSFVCTSCGGILRGLNPPHRVKSVSMATFSTTEIAFIETRGNEYCKNIYLGKYDDRSKAKPESRSDHGKLKYFMEQKYEQKKWYIPPEEAQKPLSSITDELKKANEIKPLTSLLGQNHAKIQVEKKSPPQQPKTKAQVDNILGDLNSSNAFGSSSQNSSNSGFADFGNAFMTTTPKSSASFDAFGDFTSGQQASTVSTQASAGFGNFGNVMSTTGSSQQQQSKPSDKYADLADLFNIDNAPAAVTQSASNDFGWSSSSYGTQNTSSANQTSQIGSVFGMSPQSSASFPNTAQQHSISMFSGMQQPQQSQQASLFGNAQATAGFGAMQQSSTFGGMQQPGFGQPVSSYSGMQQPAGQLSTSQQGTQMFGTNNYASAGFGQVQQHQQPQQAFQVQQTMQAYAGNTQSVTPSPSNPFMQTAGQATQAPMSHVGNPFMMQQRQQQQQPQPGWGGQPAQKPFQAQTSATNPFMAAQAQAPQSTNPFF